MEVARKVITLMKASNKCSKSSSILKSWLRRIRLNSTIAEVYRPLSSGVRGVAASISAPLVVPMVSATLPGPTSSESRGDTSMIDASAAGAIPVTFAQHAPASFFISQRVQAPFTFDNGNTVLLLATLKEVDGDTIGIVFDDDYFATRVSDVNRVK